jgi:hypothetical protein
MRRASLPVTLEASDTPGVRGKERGGRVCSDKASGQPEAVDGLVIGDTATLSNGLAMTVNGATVLTPQAPKGRSLQTGRKRARSTC